VVRGRRPVAELAAAYLKHHRTKADKDFWAFDEVQERVVFDAPDPEDAWSLVNALIAAADEEALGYVAAGPLENFVRRFAPEMIGRIEESSRRDPKFRAALGAIWLSHGDLPPAILERLVRASNGQIRPLGSRDA